ncbi:hypothetical protein PFISCL1PPCAC_25933 [Pristionchus fissidentatus]|uniref:Uncharacterized protein n=1 Tax=Pristionchus fissidentatus TaxID=1538716 RepID=A0AAV5WQR5_9BILA|nr:hypothetical protein PFISCL1PPCAC_25933 [Pristionchus fissidentatus]
MPDFYEQGLEFPLKERKRGCCLSPQTCGNTTEKMASIHLFIILVASLQSFSVFLFAGTPRDSQGIMTAYIGCSLSLLPLPFMFVALYGMVYNRPNLILVLVAFLALLMLMYILLVILAEHFELLRLPPILYLLLLLSTLHSLHAIRVLMRRRKEMIERSEDEDEEREMGRLRLEKVERGGREMYIYAQR